MKTRYVTDTMALVLKLENRKLPASIKEKFEYAESGEAEIIVPAMVFAEIAYLSEKNKIDTNLAQTKNYVERHAQIKEMPLNFKTIRQAFEINDIRELHDRLIAATAKELGIEIITNDPEIKNSCHVTATWN